MSLLLRNKAHFHRAFVADGYYMPDCKTQFCTKAWMEEVFDLSCWSPKKADIAFRTCLNPPTGREVCDMICRMIEDKEDWQGD